MSALWCQYKRRNFANSGYAFQKSTKVIDPNWLKSEFQLWKRLFVRSQTQADVIHEKPKKITFMYSPDDNHTSKRTSCGIVRRVTPDTGKNHHTEKDDVHEI